MPEVKTCCNTDIPSQCCNNAPAFDVMNTIASNYMSIYDSSGEYNINSITQYVTTASANPGYEALTPVAEGLVVPASLPERPSPMDFDRVCGLYSALFPKTQMCKKHDCLVNCTITLSCRYAEVCYRSNHLFVATRRWKMKHARRPKTGATERDAHFLNKKRVEFFCIRWI
ncbi:hypothetical protein K469DRAFT_195688 [Zopfia rhizophila CBS 207.26]|uniref:Uncharacterized protein n=1 Tax=Zopfia rhizophila CBS 207.26 TaxID=1314779 RepID=A0A6A6EWK9_9PEZI|nr:hypothetical protein K469DRAFT_195688 [Zopfia rhizophila CBS 207.26]